MGIYTDESGERIVFFEQDGLLWEENEVYGESYHYLGNNEFGYGGVPSGQHDKLNFELQKGGGVRVNKNLQMGSGRTKHYLYQKLNKTWE